MHKQQAPLLAGLVDPTGFTLLPPSLQETRRGVSHTRQMRPLSPGGRPGRKEPHLLSPARSQVWCQDLGTHDRWPSEQPWRIGSITSIPEMRKQRQRGVKRPFRDCSVISGRTKTHVWYPAGLSQGSFLLFSPFLSRLVTGPAWPPPYATA